jgi:uncharacterized protein (DUF169 family)
MKLFPTVEDMAAIPRLRRPKSIHTTDQIVAMAARLGWTVGVTMSDLVGAQCGAVIGLHPQNEEWLSGQRMAGVWYETGADAAAHQRAMDVVPYGTYVAMAVSPLAAGRLNPPDVCLIYATPAQMILLINGLQWSGYQKLQWGSGAVWANPPVPTPGAAPWPLANRACPFPAMRSGGTAAFLRMSY